MSTERQDTDDRSRKGDGEATDGLDDAVDTIRDLYAANQQVAVVGSIGVLVAVVLVVGYALSVSVPGTAIALMAWLALTAVLLGRGMTYQTGKRSAIGFGLFFLGVPTAVRLITKTPRVMAGRGRSPDTPRIAAIAITAALVVFSGWSIWRTYASR